MIQRQHREHALTEMARRDAERRHLNFIALRAEALERLHSIAEVGLDVPVSGAGNTTLALAEWYSGGIIIAQVDSLAESLATHVPANQRALT